MLLVEVVILLGTLDAVKRLSKRIYPDYTFNTTSALTAEVPMLESTLNCFVFEDFFNNSVVVKARPRRNLTWLLRHNVRVVCA